MIKILDMYYPAHTDDVTRLLVRQDGYGDFAFLPRPGSAAYYSAKQSRRSTFYDISAEALGTGFSKHVYPFISYFESAARFESGDADGAMDLIRRTWGWMASQHPGITHWKGIGANGSKCEAADTSLAPRLVDGCHAIVNRQRNPDGDLLATVDAPSCTSGTIGGSVSGTKEVQVEGGQRTVVTLVKMVM
ncbi:hypothetical protein EKO27_g3096 [Xylaria grammica]|uniref:Uncharacterized protein n=1 Tax=Xylaria grammica TaxID=363999 RepID=A0A439DC81_9PEZI|nr:hypothetical protein EKO27_g3096 [Xylaria grammica]